MSQGFRSRFDRVQEGAPCRKILRDVILEEWVGICQADQREKEKRALDRGRWGLRWEPRNLPPVGLAGTWGSQQKHEEGS